jgi:hypothetical protein
MGLDREKEGGEMLVTTGSRGGREEGYLEYSVSGVRGWCK